MGTPSHRLKLYRADKHLEDLEALLAPTRERRAYPVVESMQPKRKTPMWLYRLELTSVAPPEAFQIVLGDYLFNVRSALDHLIVAIAPRKHRHSAGFPICTKDPLAIDEASGDYLNADEARKWLTMTKGLPDDCIARLKVLQPYASAIRYGHAPKHHALALLSALQNADKHRELIAVATDLGQAELTIAGEATCIVPVVQDGAELALTPTKVDVKIEGTAVIGLERGKEAWSFDLLIDQLIGFITQQVLPRLEPFLE